MRSRFGGFVAARVARVQRSLARALLLPSLVLAALGLLAPTAASAQDFTWTGGDASTSTAWSDAQNWGGTGPSAGSVGTLTFGTLSGCTGNVPCHHPSNDIAGITANALSLSPDYSLTGDAITIGAGGIASAGGPGQALPVIEMPLTLAATQNWNLEAGGVQLFGPVSGTDPLTAEIGSGSALVFSDDAEVGPLSVSGGEVDIDSGGSLNATDDEPIIANNGTTIAGGDGDSGDADAGPIALHGSQLQVGIGFVPDSSLQVFGGVSFDAKSTYETFVDAPIADSPQLDATGNIVLGGALSLTEGSLNDESCASFTLGTATTLISDPTGTITGTFANAPNGSVVALAPCNGDKSAAASAAVITYTAHTVTATIAATTTTALSTPDPSHPLTSQRVTLTAQVRTDGGAPNGTVEFINDGSPIPGCSARPVIAGAATCSTTFAAVASPEKLTATFSQNPGAGQANSTSPAVSLAVGRNTTTTTLAVSRSSLTQRVPETYSATVTGAGAGTFTPSGRVAFRDNGRQIPGCGGQTLSTKGEAQGRALASCTISYKGAGKQAITAVYSGDDNFTSSSSSPAKTVTVIALGLAKLVHVTTSGSAATTTISCRGGSGQRCKLAIALVAGSKGKTVNVGGAHVTLAAHATNPKVLPTVRLKLNATGRRLLSKTHRLQVKLTAIQTTLGKSKKIATKTITFTRA